MLVLSEHFSAFSRVFILVLVNSDLPFTQPNSHPEKDGGPSANSLRLYQDRLVGKLSSPSPLMFRLSMILVAEDDGIMARRDLPLVGSFPASEEAGVSS